MTNRLINRNTKTITFSLPPDMAEQVQDVMRDGGTPWISRFRSASLKMTARGGQAGVVTR